MRQVSLPQTAASECRMQMQRRRIMDAGSDAALRQPFAKCVAVRRPDDIKVAHGIRTAFHRLDNLAVTQQRIVDSGYSPALGVPLLPMRQEGPQKASLHFVETGVDSANPGNLVSALAAFSKTARALGGLDVISDNGATVPQAAQVFGWIKTVSHVGRKICQRPAAIARAVRLARVLHQRRRRPASQIQKTIQRANLAVKMNRKDGRSVRRDSLSCILGVEQQS